jgi:hypothetical protein
VEIVRFQVQGVGVRKQAGELLGDGFPVFLGDADVNGHGMSPVFDLGMKS